MQRSKTILHSITSLAPYPLEPYRAAQHRFSDRFCEARGALREIILDEWKGQRKGRLPGELYAAIHAGINSRSLREAVMWGGGFVLMRKT
jgi:hypothetical protein